MRTRSGSTPELLDRQRERAALDGLLGDLRSGRGRALIVRGEAGVGKSALLEYAAGSAADMRVARAAGAESEMELAFAGLHLLCAPLLDGLEGLPGPQRDALRVAFGMREGDTPDRFMVGLAVLTLLSEELRSCREAGLLAQLVIWVNTMALLTTLRGDFAATASLVAEAEGIAAATGTRHGPLGAVALAGFRGAEAEAAPMIQAVIADARAAGQGVVIQFSQWASAVLYNGLGRYEEALADAQAAEQAPEMQVAMWALPELIEAASRTGQTRLAAGALARLADATSIGQTDWGQGIYARSRALLGEGQDAERCYREAVGRLSRTGLRPELARAHLLYGEWLRREGRRADARVQLRVAHDMLAAIGMQAFAERARRELLATGETVRKRAADTRDRLTPQETQIARLARTGMSNPEIAAQLFLSPRTVEYHLAKVFAKLDIASRRQLRQALPDSGRDGLVGLPAPALITQSCDGRPHCYQESSSATASQRSSRLVLCSCTVRSSAPSSMSLA